MTVKPKQYKPPNFKSGKRFTFLKSGRAKGYDSFWEKYRRRFLYHNPNCYCCPNRANVVDHIEVHRGDGELFKKLDNHLPLCKLCHDTITGKFDRLKVQDLEGKLNWIHKTKTQYNNKIKVKILAKY